MALQQRLHDNQEQCLGNQDQLLETQERLQDTQDLLLGTQVQLQDTLEQLAKVRSEKADLLWDVSMRLGKLVKQHARLFPSIELVERQVRSLQWERWSWEARFWKMLRERDGLSLEFERLKHELEDEICERYTIVDQREQEMEEAAELRKGLEEVKQELMWKSVEIRFLRIGEWRCVCQVQNVRGQEQLRRVAGSSLREQVPVY